MCGYCDCAGSAEWRPPLGCRLLSQRCFCSLVPGAVADLGDWVAATRLKVARLLHTLVLHQELGVTQYLAKLAAALTGALADEEPDVRLWVRPVLPGQLVPSTAIRSLQQWWFPMNLGFKGSEGR